MSTARAPSRLKSFVVVTLIIAAMASVAVGILAALAGVLALEHRAHVRDIPHMKGDLR